VSFSINSYAYLLKRDNFTYARRIHHMDASIVIVPIRYWLMNPPKN